MVNEDVINATPCPCFTPKLWQPARNHKNASLSPVAEVSDSSGVGNTLLFQPLDFEELVTGEESADDSDPQPLAKKLKAHTTGKAILKVGYVSPPQKKSQKATLCAEEIVPTLDEAALDEEMAGKPKKVKPKVREEINIQVKEIEEKRIRNMVKLSLISQQEMQCHPYPHYRSRQAGFSGGGR